MQTITFSNAHGHALKFDLYLPANASGPLPAIIGLHSGGMVSGSRRDKLFPPEWLLKGCQLRGIILISSDYRLVLPSTALDQIEDMKALFAFLASPQFSESKTYFPEGTTLDCTRLAVAGFSGGAYCASMAGLYASPRPRAVLLMYGMSGDFLIDYYISQKSQPSIPIPYNVEHISALTSTQQAVITESPLIMSPRGPSDALGRFGLYAIWNRDGTILDYIFDYPKLGEKLRNLPYQERALAVPAELRFAFPQLELNATFPPTYLVHGVDDVVVLSCESETMYARLQELGVKSKLHLLEHAGHGLIAPGTASPAKGASEALQSAFDFLATELGV